MSASCLGCSCGSVSASGQGSLLLLATRVDHTVGALRSLALRQHLTVQEVAPGLMVLETDAVDSLIAAACQELTVIEAQEVRCLVLASTDLTSTAVLSQAMTASPLAEAGARIEHADLVQLFEDEDRCFYSDYQPIVNLADGRVFGHEALLRAQTSLGGRVMPDELFPAAEAAGWIHLLDRVGRTTALRDAGSWLGDDLLFINFIPTSIYRPEVCLRTTESAARDAGVRLDQLVFEVTEGHKIDDVSHLERVFDYYRSRDCKVALDDLGAGYSSLNLLIRLQPDIVKLDKEIVQDLPGPIGSAVVSAIVDIVHAYGGLVLAECVETNEQADAASYLGVDLAQGWLFGRPQRRVGAGLPAPKSAGRLGEVQPHHPDKDVAIASVPDRQDCNERSDEHLSPYVPSRMGRRFTSSSS
jgi:EAL domain-containing protein (putative c-di-GMP-specific phosphodiesterase class I)